VPEVGNIVAIIACTRVVARPPGNDRVPCARVLSPQDHLNGRSYLRRSDPKITVRICWTWSIVIAVYYPSINDRVTDAQWDAEYPGMAWENRGLRDRVIRTTLLTFGTTAELKYKHERFYSCKWISKTNSV